MRYACEITCGRFSECIIVHKMRWMGRRQFGWRDRESCQIGQVEFHLVGVSRVGVGVDIVGVDIVGVGVVGVGDTPGLNRVIIDPKEKQKRKLTDSRYLQIGDSAKHRV